MGGSSVSAADLLTDLHRLGIRLEVHGDRLRYSSRSVVTPALADQLRAHKSELLALLRTNCDMVTDSETGALRPGDPWDSAIDPPEPCPDCGSLELWQSFDDDWRCQKCSPPTKSRELAKKASELRRLAKILKTTPRGTRRTRSRLGAHK